MKIKLLLLALFASNSVMPRIIIRRTVTPAPKPVTRIITHKKLIVHNLVKNDKISVSHTLLKQGIFNKKVISTITLPQRPISYSLNNCIVKRIATSRSFFDKDLNILYAGDNLTISMDFFGSKLIIHNYDYKGTVHKFTTDLPAQVRDLQYATVKVVSGASPKIEIEMPTKFSL